MEIKYIPNLGIEIDSEKIFWEDNRKEIRLKLRNLHKENDFEMDNSESFGGDNSFNIVQKRDIYENIKNEENLFFLNYNNENELTEIEFHIGIKLNIGNETIEIGEEMISVLEKLNYSNIGDEDGNFFLEELKLNISNDEFVGGDGSGLSYIYISKDKLERE